MKRLQIFIRCILLTVLVGALASAGFADEKVFSNTTPKINLTHIFDGEINKSGKPVGFHSRPLGKDPEKNGVKLAGLVTVIDKPNKYGVYTAKVWIRQQDKTKTSTLYPDKMSRDEIIQAVLNAYKNRTSLHGEKFSGPSGKGFTIEGYTLGNDCINTAYPIYQGVK